MVPKNHWTTVRVVTWFRRATNPWADPRGVLASHFMAQVRDQRLTAYVFFSPLPPKGRSWIHAAASHGWKTPKCQGTCQGNHSFPGSQLLERRTRAFWQLRFSGLVQAYCRAIVLGLARVFAQSSVCPIRCRTLSCPCQNSKVGALVR